MTRKLQYQCKKVVLIENVHRPHDQLLHIWSTFCIQYTAISIA